MRKHVVLSKLQKAKPCSALGYLFTNKFSLVTKRNFHRDSPLQIPVQPKIEDQLLSKFLDRFKYSWATALGKIFFIAMIGWLFNIWAGLYNIYSELTVNKRIANVFKEVSKREEEFQTESEKYIPRTEVENDLMELFQAKNCYVLVYGEHCVGKTTVVNRIITKAREKGIPLFYFPVESQEGIFLRSFFAALKGYDIIPGCGSLTWDQVMKKRLGFEKEPPASFTDLLPPLANAGSILKEETNKRPVLIIDNCNNLEQQPEGLTILKELQNFAKEQADKNKMLVIFVTSEGKAPQILCSRSAASRMTRYRIGELNHNEAEQYLIQTMGIQDDNTRAKILNITGNTFEYLNFANAKTIEKLVSSSIVGYLKEVGLDEWRSDQNFVKVSKEILANQKIEYLDYLSAMEDRVEAKKILEGNIFSSYIETDGTVSITFQNTATRNFFDRNLK